MLLTVQWTDGFGKSNEVAKNKFLSENFRRTLIVKEERSGERAMEKPKI